MKKTLSLLLFVLLSLCMLLTSCGNPTLKKAQKAFDDGEYEQAIDIIQESEENLSDNEDLYALFVASYQEWSKEQISVGQSEVVINKLKTSGLKASDDNSIKSIFDEAIRNVIEDSITGHDCSHAYSVIRELISDQYITDNEAKEYFYMIGSGFEESSQFAAAGIAYSRAEGYKDADVKCKESWDKGAFRNTISISDSIAIGIKADGTIITARDPNLMGESIFGTTASDYEKTDKKDLADWKNIVSVCCDSQSNDSIALCGLTSDGTVKTFGSLAEEKKISADNWKDIVAVSMGYMGLVGLDKHGKVLLTGGFVDNLSGALKWDDIIDIQVDSIEDLLIGTDLFGKVHVIDASNPNIDGIINTDEQNEYEDYYALNPSVFSGEKIKQLRFSYESEIIYGTYITSEGHLIAVYDELGFEDEPYESHFDGIGSVKKGNKTIGFVQCSVGNSNYIGLLSDGTVRVGGSEGELLEKTSYKKWKDIKEVTIFHNIQDIIAGVASDGSVNIDCFEDEETELVKRIKSWGKLKKPTVMYDTSGFNN